MVSGVRGFGGSRFGRMVWQVCGSIGLRRFGNRRGELDCAPHACIGHLNVELRTCGPNPRTANQRTEPTNPEPLEPRLFLPPSADSALMTWSRALRASEKSTVSVLIQ